MSEYTVKLLPSAEDDLAAIWLATPDPAAVTRAGAAADKMLRHSPAGSGAYAAEGLYRLTVDPLVFYYAIDDAQRPVVVSNVREVRH